MPDTLLRVLHEFNPHNNVGGSSCLYPHARDEETCMQVPCPVQPSEEVLHLGIRLGIWTPGPSLSLMLVYCLIQRLDVVVC